ncbi:hypothetical protein [Mycobacterium sp.]|uniref:hypothetical protein n=1 Tax=Mycobacterium sp. TaxID=1785 RepID=UPI002D1F9C0C|nr:hypothetical protein [Mycobacterium sp.]
MRSRGPELPWPTAWLCTDGVRRDLSVFRPEEWTPTRPLAAAVNVDRYKEVQFHSERGSAAPGLNRSVLVELSAQLRVGRGGRDE